ncbi:MAG: anthranilate synthase component I [Eubacteriaceae bacterium]|nr:anthranilate synthase component I [Eubacteriaceae bacterium]
MLYPSMEEYQKLKEEYTVIPFVSVIHGDTDTPISIFKKLCNGGKSFLLESVEGGSKWGRYSYIGRNPYGEITSRDGITKIATEDGEVLHEGKSLDNLKMYFGDIKYPKTNSLIIPEFPGGAVGYVTYDLVREIETLPQENPDELNVPEIHLLMMKEIIVYDHMKQKIFIVYNSFKQNVTYGEIEKKLNDIAEEIRTSPVKPDKSVKSGEVVFESNETEESFCKKVVQAKEYIRKGDIFQVVLSQRLKAKTDIDPFAAYRVLRSVNPSPYLYYMNFEDYCVVGSSPELLVKVADGVIETCPIAGTRPRGKTEEEDQELAADLLEDDKERAEHLMLLDLARNDIGRVSEFGSVEVTHFMEIQKYSHVMHIVSNVAGRIREKYDMFDALKACLPAGTLSGAPKVRAMEIIEELENTRRGIYGGGVGYFGFNGNMDTCITIRTVIFKDGYAIVQAGAGIVADSVPESEYRETMSKARAVLETIKKAGE